MLGGYELGVTIDRSFSFVSLNFIVAKLRSLHKLQVVIIL